MSSYFIVPSGRTISNIAARNTNDNHGNSVSSNCRTCLKEISKEDLRVQVNNLMAVKSQTQNDYQGFRVVPLSFCLNIECLHNQSQHKQRNTGYTHWYPDFNEKLLIPLKVCYQFNYYY